MNGFATKVRYSFAFLGSGLPAAQTPASGTFDLGDGVSGAASETI